VLDLIPAHARAEIAPWPLYESKTSFLCCDAVTDTEIKYLQTVLSQHDA
jgi:hypothetical protein